MPEIVPRSPLAVNQPTSSEKEQVIYDREAQALMDLGKRFNRPDWVQFGQEMYEAGQAQKKVVQEHNQNLPLQNKMYKKSDKDRVRDQ